MTKAIRITQDSARALKSAAICCSPRLRKTIKAVGGTCRLWPNSPTASRLFSPAYSFTRIGFTRDQEFSSAVNLQDK
jgi:hypothetical protein